MAFKEALQNMVKHSGASEVRLALAMDNGHFVIRVSDNGRGLPEHPEKSDRSGLENMKSRLAGIGGICDIRPTAAGGTRSGNARACPLISHPAHAHPHRHHRGQQAFALMIAKHFKRPGSGVQCVAVYGTAEEALEKLPADPPQVALVDINLPGMSGIECIARLRELCPELLCIVLTTFEEDALIFEALKAGACGYLLKRASPDELTEAIKQAVSGGAPMSPQIARQVVGFFHSRPPRKDETPLCPARTGNHRTARRRSALQGNRREARSEVRDRAQLCEEDLRKAARPFAHGCDFEMEGCPLKPDSLR